MTSITWKNGGPVFRNGMVGTGSGCCCGGCQLLFAAESGQTVSMSSDCSCKTGALSGSSALAMTITPTYASGGATIATNCEYEIDGVTYYSSAYVSVSCCECEDGGQCYEVSVYAYTWDNGGSAGYSSMGGSSCSRDLTIDASGKITGTTTIDAYSCTATLTFG